MNTTTAVLMSINPFTTENPFWGQNYLDIVGGGVRGLSRGQGRLSAKTYTRGTNKKRK